MPMAMTSRLRKLALTAHITFSVGWLGFVASFVLLSVAGLTSQDAEIVRGSYLAMGLMGPLLVPVSFAAWLTGLVLALGTRWGLFRHYWVVVKFALTTGAIIALLAHVNTAILEAARLVSRVPAETLSSTLSSAGHHHGGLGMQLALDSGAALLVLLTTTILAVYKPWGRTRYGRRQQATQAS